MFRYSLSNLMLALLPLGVAFLSGKALVLSVDLRAGVLLLAVLVTMVTAAFGALTGGKEGLKRGLMLGVVALLMTGVGVAACVSAVMLLLSLSGLVA